MIEELIVGTLESQERFNQSVYDSIEDIRNNSVSRREHFAGLAMQAMLSTVSDGHPNYDLISSDAVEMANSLIKALESNNE